MLIDRSTKREPVQEYIFASLIPIMALIYSVAFLLLWLRAREQYYILALVFAGAIRSFAVFSGDFIFDPTSMPGDLFRYSCFTLSVILLVWALCERCGKQSYLKLHLAIMAVGFVLVMVASSQQNYLAEILVRGIVLGLIAGSGAHTLATAAPRNVLDRVITWLTAIYAAQFFIRPISAVIFAPGLNSQNVANSAYDAVSIVALALMTVLHSTALIAAIMTDQFHEKEVAAHTDPLTGMKIRGEFEREAMVRLERAVNEQVPVSIIVADIDHFKQVNDIWGHQAGDTALANFGRLIQQKIRRSDIAGRIGGEEFAILVWNCRSEVAQQLAERIRSAFAQQSHDVLSKNVRLTASFGVAECCSGEGYGKLFARADAALYRAKQAGRDCVETDHRNAPREPAGHPLLGSNEAA